MLISTRTTIRSLIFSSALLCAAGLPADDAAAAKQDDQWSQVEADAAKARQEAEARARAEAEAVARREAEAWKQLDAERSNSAEEVQKNLAEERKTAEACAERDAALERAKAETAAQRVRAEAAEKARADAENARAEAEAEVKRARAEAAAERAKAEAAEKARAEAEAPAKAGTEAPAKAGTEAPAKAEAEAPAKVEAEAPAKVEAEAPAKAEAAAAQTADDSDEGESTSTKVGRALLWYIPNRLSDLMDVFTLELGAGELGIDLQLTRFASLGAGVGSSYMLGWSIYNQHGVYWQQGWYADLLNRRYGEVRRDKVCGYYTPFSRSDDGRVDIGKMDKAKAEDPYAIGIKACCYLNLKFQIHVTELADFVAGIFFIDFKDDDKPQINWVF